MSDLHTRRPARSTARPQLRCSRTVTDGTVHVVLRGELDIATVPPLDRALRRAHAISDIVVLDLSGLEFVECRGAHVLLDADRRMRAAGGRLIITRVTPTVRRFLALIGVDRLLEIAADDSASLQPALIAAG